MPNRRAFVNDLYPGCLQCRHEWFWTTPRGLDNLDSALPDGGDVFRIGRRRERRQERQIDAERLVRHIATACDFLGQQLRRLLRQTGDDPEASGVRYGRREFCKTDIMHPALDD